MVRELGEGGMAKVFLAVQEALDREVAIKVLSTDLVADQEFCKRFLKEGKILARVSHPHVVTIYDSGEHEGSFYMCMEFVRGGTLEDRLVREPLSASETVQTIKQMASALQWSHSKGLIHRDVKPANVLYREDGTSVLSDFGIAKTTRQEATKMTAMGMAIGTPTYMSPEQASAAELTPKSDQYSLGVMLFEMLAGRAPYQAETAVLVAVQHIQADIPKLPPEFERFQPVIDRMMAKDPAQRFDSMEELATALDNIVVSRTEYFEAPQKSASSLPKPAVYLAGGAAAVLLAAGAVYFFVGREAQPPAQVAVAPPTPAMVVVRPEPADPMEVAKWLDIAATHNDIGRLFDPPGNNALEAYWKVLALDATNADALAGLGGIANRIAPLARESLESGEIDDSRLLVEKGLQADPNNKALLALQKELNAL